MKNEQKLYAYLIASNLTRLPSEMFLACDLTEHQLKYWLTMRDRTCLEGAYLYTLLSGLNDPLPELVEKRMITEWERQTVIKQSNFYMRFWELVQTTEPHVRRAWLDAGLDYPLESAGMYSAAYLFSSVLRNLIDSKFKESLNTYFNCTVKDINLVAADTQGKIKQPQKKHQARIAAKKLTQGQDEVINLLEFCDYMARKDDVIKMRLEWFNAASSELVEHLESASKRTRNTSQSQKLRSYVWHDGVLKYGQEGGTYA